jgi:hypothetical protein
LYLTKLSEYFALAVQSIGIAPQKIVLTALSETLRPRSKALSPINSRVRFFIFQVFLPDFRPGTANLHFCRCGGRLYRWISKAFRRICKPCRRICKAFRRVGKVYLSICKAYRRVCKACRRICKAYRRVCKACRRICKACRRICKLYRCAGKFCILTRKACRSIRQALFCAGIPEILSKRFGFVAEGFAYRNISSFDCNYLPAFSQD